LNTYAFQLMTEPLSEEMINRISPIRGAYSDIRPVIDYYRVTNENRSLFGAATPFVEHIPQDLKAWNRNLMLKIFPYLKDVKIDLAWGGPMATGPISSLKSARSAVVPTPFCAGLRRLRGDAQPHHLQGIGRGHE
jgi:glycine/D-amino acid oxidase-like deaminating enzyme